MQSTLLNFFTSLGKPSAVGAFNPLPALIAGPNYELVPQNSANQILGGTGAVGDRLDFVVFMPSILACGSVTINDNATLVALYGGGTVAPLADLKPSIIPIFTKSLTGPWKVTTGVSVAALCIGKFT